MSRAAVRDALQTYLTAGNIPGLHEVFRAVPRWVDGSAWQLNDTLGSGAVAAIHINEQQEARVTVPAPNVLFPGRAVGQKMRDYRVGVMVFYQYLIPSGGLTAVTEDAWAAPLDTILDGIVDWLEADPLIGTSGQNTVWQAAQEPGDPKITTDIPKQLAGKVIAWSVVEFTVAQVVTA